MAQLAIKGHPTRGAEVIEILKMLGGTNPYNYSADSNSFCFYIGKGINDINVIYCDWIHARYDDEELIVFSLEEFEKKFPYKVGDKVLINGDVTDVYTITSMTWGGLRVVYKIRAFDGIDDVHDWFADEMKPYKEETVKEKIQAYEVTEEFCANEIAIEFDPSKFEMIERNGKYFVVKKQPQYPKTYKECCEVLRIPKNEHYIDIDAPLVPSNYNKLVSTFTKLLICRDAYWKIAGDWKPDWKDFSTQKYSISVDKDKIILSQRVTGSRVLVFPTIEMRDAFYENFKELIEQCKELL